MKLKICRRCNKSKNSLTDFYPKNYRKRKVATRICIECIKKQEKEYRLLKLKGAPDYYKVLYQKRKNNPKYKIQLKKWEYLKRQRLRMAVLEHYGGIPPKCACCGESNYEFLAIDHINGGGGKHHKLVVSGKLGKKYGGVMQFLYYNNFPKGFRVLCHNCNCAKGFYGYCPHKKDNSHILKIKESKSNNILT